MPPDCLRIDDLILFRQHYRDSSFPIQIPSPHYTLILKGVPPQYLCNAQIATCEVPLLPSVGTFGGSIKEVVCSQWVAQKEGDWVNKESRDSLL